ncbi:hypothetical protein [Chitinophaga sp. S165]|nr:hypothetical protein [Chitinophaga sp. S165]
MALGIGAAMGDAGSGALSGGAGAFVQGTGNAMVFGHMSQDEALT